MKSREQIENEYENFQIKSNDVTSLEEFKLFLQMGIDDSDERIKDSINEKRINKLYEIEAKIKNLFSLNGEIIDTQIFVDDSELLDKYISFQKVYKEYFESILFITRDYNYKELLKFCDFLIEHYYEHIEYIEYLRQQNEFNYEGISFYNSNYSNNRDVMISFYFDKMSKFEEEFDKIEGNDTSECIPIRRMKANWYK